jgi:MFS family permease
LGEGIGYYGSTIAIATAIGPAIAVYVDSLGLYALPFWSAAVLLILVWPMAKLGRIKNLPEQKQSAPEPREKSGNGKRLS